MWRLVLVLSMFAALLAPSSVAFAQVAPCQFILGFKTLHDLDPADIGNCLDNQAYAANGDAQQHTTNGLMAWRKLDNWTAFTNGYWTWINGPSGLAKRLNTQRFSWEANPNNLPLADAATSQDAWDSAFATKYSVIDGVNFAFTVAPDPVTGPGTYPLLEVVMNDGLTGLGVQWDRLPQAPKQQAVTQMLQDVKSHWPGQMVAVNVEGKPFYTWTYYDDSDPFAVQVHEDATSDGWYTTIIYGTGFYDPGFGDTVQVQ